MDCEYTEKISLLIDGQLASSEETEARNHLAACAECRRAKKSFLAWRGQIQAIDFERDPAVGNKILREIIRRGKVRKSLRKNFFTPARLVTASVLLFVLCLSGILIYTRLPQISWEVVRLEGAPQIGARSVVEKGNLNIGEWLETDEKSRARIAVADIGAVEVEPNTRLRLVQTKSDEHRLELNRGFITAKINAPPRLFFVNTPSATIIDYGCTYTLDVDERGDSILSVTEGWVSLVLNGRETLVPASASAKSRRGAGPGTPYFEDASGKFTDALTSFDFENGGSDALGIIIAEARRRDALSLWYLLERTDSNDRERIFERLNSFVPLPPNATRDDLLSLNRQMLDDWKEIIEVVSIGESFASKNTNRNNFGKLNSIGEMTAPRAGHTATKLSDGKVLIVGGMQKPGDVLSNAEIFDPPTGQFTATNSLNFARYNHTATQLSNGDVLITGGADEQGNPVAETEIYHPATRNFTIGAKLLKARTDHQATLLSDGQVLITGGIDSNHSILKTAEIYDAAKNIFTSGGDLNEARRFHAATLLDNGNVLITGGSNGEFSADATLASAELYNPAIRAFSSIGNMTERRYAHAATKFADGRVLITGGSGGREWKDRLTSAEIYDARQNTFSKTGAMSLPRFYHQSSVVSLPSGKILIAGAGARLEIFDPATGTFSSTAGSVGTGRIFSTATLLDNEQILIAGGYNFDYPPTASAWIFEP